MALDNFGGTTTLTYTLSSTAKTVTVQMKGDNQFTYSGGSVVFFVPPEATVPVATAAAGTGIAASVSTEHSSTGSVDVRAYLTSDPVGANQSVTVTWNDATTTSNNGICPTPMPVFGTSKA